MKRLLILIGLLSLLMGTGATAVAKDISSLTDAEVRQLLLERLDEKEAESEPAFNPAMVAWEFQKGFSKVVGTDDQ